MQAPTSRYGCGADTCIACYGDPEWQKSRLLARIEELNDLVGRGEIDHDGAAELLSLEEDLEDLEEVEDGDH